MLRAPDYIKAAVTAIAIVAANVAISYVVMAAYAYFIDTGQDAAYYEAAAQKIAPWSSVVFGAVLFFAAAFILGKRRPDRSAIGFALTVFVVYAIIEFVVMASAGQLAPMIGIVAFSLTTKLGAAFLGAKAAQPKQTVHQ